MDQKIKYLEMIQSIIKRMASNCFALKGWAVTLVAGIFALSGNNTEKLYFLVSYVPVLVFWGLDSYYLLQERLYRELFEVARNLPPDNPVSFSLSVAALDSKGKRLNYWNCVKSLSEIGFYLPLAFLCALIIIITHM